MIRFLFEFYSLGTPVNPSFNCVDGTTAAAFQEEEDEAEEGEEGGPVGEPMEDAMDVDNLMAYFENLRESAA